VKAIFASQPQSRVALLHAGRCGSTVLGELLNKHSEICWGGEVFQAKMLSQRHLALVGNLRGNKKILREIEMFQATKDVYGIEVKYLPHQHMRRLGLNHAGLVSFLKNSNYSHVIHLTRANLLKQIVSALIAEASNFYHTNQSVDEPNSIYVDVNRIFEEGSWYDKAFKGGVSLLGYLSYALSNQQGIDDILENWSVLDLQYEKDIEASPLVAYSKICEYVGVRIEEAPVGLQRTNPFALSKLIANYSDVQRHLRNTQFEWMLEE